METKAKIDSQTIRGFLKLLVPTIFAILAFFNVHVEQAFQNEIIEVGVKAVETILLINGLWDVYRGRHTASTQLGGWFKA